MINKSFLVLLLASLFGQINLHSQYPGSYPGLPTGIVNNKFQCGSNHTDALTGFMPHKTPEQGQYLRILIIYVRFPDDNLQGDQMNGASVWWNPAWERPLNPYTTDNTFIDLSEGDPNIPFMERYRNYTLSDYFCEMSMGEFDVIGDEYYVTMPLTSVEYKESGFDCSDINAEAIRIADNLYNIDFKKYNNWTLNINQWEWTPGGGDNIADMIVMEYRRAPGYPEELWFIEAGIPASGISDLGNISPLMLDSTFIYSSSGVTCLSLMQNYSKLTQIIQHEMCHRYFFNHYEIGLMTGAEHSSFSFSPYERRKLEYVTPNTVDFPFPETFRDYTLGDYISTGDLLIVNLPSSEEKFIFTNSQKVSVYDGISRGSKTCYELNKAQQDPYCPVGKGLYIYHEMPPSECSNFKEVILKQADGSHNWYVDRWVPYFVPGYTFEIPLFETSSGNIISGKSEFHQVIDTSLGSQQEVNDDPCSDKPGDFFVTIDWLGDGKDAFNPGYNEILSPFSNPSSNLCSDMKTGFTMHVLGKDSLTGAITIRIYSDHMIAASEMPPSKPMNLKVDKNITDSLSGRFNPKLKWDRNIEPDIAGGFYKIYRGILPSCSAGIEPDYELLTTISSDTNEYTDLSVTLYPYGGGPVVCANLFRSVSYKIEAVDNSGKASLKSERSLINGYTERCDDSVLVGIWNNQIPVEFGIFNYPNPFNPATSIKYSLPVSSLVTIKIYNILGAEVKTLLNHEYKAAGFYNVTFDGSSFSSGVYFCRIEAGSYNESRKMVLIK